MIIINISQAKAWVTLMKEADDGDGTLTYEVLFMLFMIFMLLMLLVLLMMVILMRLLVFMLLMINYFHQ